MLSNALETLSKAIQTFSKPSANAVSGHLKRHLAQIEMFNKMHFPMEGHISSELKELEKMSEKSKEKLSTKVEKACTTRWLSLDKSIGSVETCQPLPCRNSPALLQTFRWYQNKIDR